MVNNFMQDNMNDETASMNGGMNRQVNYMNEYGDEMNPMNQN